MVIVKIPTRTSWAKVTWKRKRKEKRRKKIIKTISKDNKMIDSLIAQIKR